MVPSLPPQILLNIAYARAYHHQVITPEFLVTELNVYPWLRPRHRPKTFGTRPIFLYTTQPAESI